MTQNFWDGYTEDAAKTERGGGGLICLKARVETGYKVFASGVGQEESFFPAPYTDKAARKVAKRAAQTLANEQGGKFAWGFAIITPAAETYKQAAPVTWEVNTMVRFIPHYADARDIVLDSLREHGVAADGEDRAIRLSFVDDPYAVENDRKDKEGRYEQVAIVTEVFKNVALAKEAIKEMPTFDDEEESGDVPPGYAADEWDEFSEQIKLDLAGGASPDQLATDYDVPTKYIEALMPNEKTDE